MWSLVSDFGFDVFGVTETWLHPDTPSDCFQIPGYSLLRCDRKTTVTHRAGGGVAMYIKEDILHEPYTIVDVVDPGIEHLCVVLKVKGVRIGLCVIYRPPHLRYSCLTALFRSLFVDLAVEVKSVLCMGDTNIDLSTDLSNDAKFMSRLLRELNAVQIINFMVASL